MGLRFKVIAIIQISGINFDGGWLLGPEDLFNIAVSASQDSWKAENRWKLLLIEFFAQKEGQKRRRYCFITVIQAKKLR